MVCMIMRASIRIATRDHYEFTKTVKRLSICGAKNLRASSIDNYIYFEAEDLDRVFTCLEDFGKIFLTVDLKVYLRVSSDRLNELISSSNAKKMPMLYPYRIVAIVNNKDYHIAIQKTSNKNVYIARCIRATNPDIILSPSIFLFSGTMDAVKGEVRKCIELLNKVLSEHLRKPNKLYI